MMDWTFLHPATIMASITFILAGAVLVLEARWRRRLQLNERATSNACRQLRANKRINDDASAGLVGWLPSAANIILPVVPARDRLRTKDLLAGAGLRDQNAVIRFFGLKVAAFGMGAIISFTFLLWWRLLIGYLLWQFLVVLAGAFLGNLVPELGIRYWRRRRRDKIRASLANALDLMIITANAGQSLDAAMSRVGNEIARIAPELADELKTTTSELQALPSRRDALQNLAQRSGLSEMRSLTATLIQTIKYGTPLNQALKTLAAELRQARLIYLEEKAAKLPALLSLPLMLLIMPAVFIVTAGPAVLNLIDTFSD